MTILNVPVPRAIPPGGATVRPFEFAVRTLLDYDMTFLQDRLVSEVFVNGQKAGVYAATRVDEQPRDEYERRMVIERYGPDLERVVIDEFMGLGYRRQVRDLEREVSTMRDRIALLERSWYRRVLDKIRPPKDTDDSL